jgi:O-antigen ligase
MLICLVHFKKQEVNKFSNVPQTKWLALILVMFWLCSFTAVNPSYHQQASIEVTKLFIILMIGYKLIDTPVKLQHALWAYIIGAAYIGMEAKRVGRNGYGRVEGIGTVTTDDANGIAAMLAPTVAILMFYVWRSTSYKKKIIFALLGAYIVNGIILINSRGSFLGVVAGGGYFIMSMLTAKFQEDNQKKTALMIIVVSLAGGLYLTDDSFWDRMNTLQDVTEEDGGRSGSNRTKMWVSTFDIMEDYPLGVGAAGFQEVSPLYVPEEMFFGQNENKQKQKAVHSMWFQSLAELGWPGPVLLILLITSCFRLTSRTKAHLIKQNDPHHYFQVVALEAALLSFIVAGTFIDEFRSELFYWLILFTACAGNIYLVKSEQAQQVNK